ncbi:hypothetical protein [Kitasatospora purpeofusca]|uniref:hypothetical protein n=1 Tax=Kitasatospora purpeofusca TaxID=67352 RepID=UPI00225C3745|nr:hypothetical protein [Kitasatospora purpeofusca]MCX4752911.1 hypothetical protein [Kitasatospora purpeofusca]WSR32454.1 hypothetical protein OG715_16560 [Kitasatospora purpeofusca]WSR40542.1 hypothetical protein OG196_16345 [Kitasatospora purpeofusca]
MDLFTVTDTVNRAGSAFGFCTALCTGMTIYFKDGHTLRALKPRAVWLPWSGAAVTTILASAVTGGAVNKAAAAVTGSGNRTGQDIGSVALGKADAAKAPVAVTEVLSYSGSWLALAAVIGLGLSIWYAKGWRPRILALSGCITGATWGIASSVGGWTAKVSIPVVSWLGTTVIG